jgi:hypothetical protein
MYGRKTTHRRSTRHRVHHKRRRIGAAGPKGQLLTVLLSAAAGGIVGKFIADKLVTFLPATLSTTVQSYIKGGLLAAAGGFLTFKFTNPLVKGLGVGLFVEGVHSVGQAAGIVSGMGRTDPASLVFPRGAKVGNYYNVRTINGGTDFPRPNTVGAHRRPAVTVMGGL